MNEGGSLNCNKELPRPVHCDWGLRAAMVAKRALGDRTRPLPYLGLRVLVREMRGSDWLSFGFSARSVTALPPTRPFSALTLLHTQEEGVTVGRAPFPVW